MKNKKPNKILWAFLMDFLVINAAFFLAVLLKRGRLELPVDYKILLLSIYGLWLFTGILSKKYSLIRIRIYGDGLQVMGRSFVYLIFLLFFVIFIFKLFSYSRFIILSTVFIFVVLDFLTYTLFYFFSLGLVMENGLEDLSPKDIAWGETSKVVSGIESVGREIREPLRATLREIYLKQNEELLDFISSSVNLDRIKSSNALLLSANSAASVESILHDRLEFLGNIHKINDIQRINKFLMSVNEKLVQGGYFLGVVETIEQRLHRKFSGYPTALRRIFYFGDFIWTRLCSNLPILKQLYVMIYGRGNSVISKYELLGRLYFCGFNLVSFKEIRENSYFIVRKIRPPQKDENPSYGPIFKQKRIGRNGEIIYIYKFRTMYPYSEFIHKYMYDMNKLDNIGKIKNDLRITPWGRIMRHYWIDELPMIISLLQGDIKLVGVRPISHSFLSLYPEELRKARMKHKPGLIPAFYADRPRTIEEIWESEKKYLKSYEKHPWRTDFIYFFKVMNNILFHKARSA